MKLSRGKATKVKKICSDIESLIPNSTPSLSQVLLSLSIYRKRIQVPLLKICTKSVMAYRTQKQNL